MLSIRGCSLGRRGGRGGGGRGLGGGAGGGGNVTKVVVTWGGHGADDEEPFTPPIAACCEVIVGDVAGEVAAEFNTSVVPFPDTTLVGADWPGPGDWFPKPVIMISLASVARMKKFIYGVWQRNVQLPEPLFFPLTTRVADTEWTGIQCAHTKTAATQLLFCKYSQINCNNTVPSVHAIKIWIKKYEERSAVLQ